jgi:hypothetical protein
MGRLDEQLEVMEAVEAEASVGRPRQIGGLAHPVALVGSLHNDAAALLTRFLLVASGFLLAYPETVSNLVDLGLLVPTVILGRYAAKVIARPTAAAAAAAAEPIPPPDFKSPD